MPLAVISHHKRTAKKTMSFFSLVAVGAIGAVLLFVPPSSFPAIFSIPLFSWWLAAWFLDARLTMKNWSQIQSYEANVLVRPLARRIPARPWMVFVIHALFSLGASAGLQALVTHTFDIFLTSCILAIFGVLHIEAFYHNRAFFSRQRY